MESSLPSGCMLVNMLNETVYKVWLSAGGFAVFLEAGYN
jgi:hypothetical protein